MVTLLSNRLGDFFLLLRFVTYISFGWIVGRRAWSFVLPPLIFVACLTKRAQVPFRVWLPMAIRAPTPIRALVHSSTLVTAGILIVIKFHHFTFSAILFPFGCITLRVAGIRSLLEIDLKKVVALSTLRQLGFMLVGLSLGLLSIVLFHIIRHAFMKRALFILVGCYLHRNWGRQDKRRVRFRVLTTPYLLSSVVIRCIALRGIRLTRGIVTKEALLLSIRGDTLSFFGRAALRLGVCCTLLYCYRIIKVCEVVGLYFYLLGTRVKSVVRRGLLVGLRIVLA